MFILTPWYLVEEPGFQQFRIGTSLLRVNQQLAASMFQTVMHAINVTI
jgi:hypothetical protein